MAKRIRPPPELEVLRRLVDAQDRILVAYRFGGRTPTKAIGEATKCRAWLVSIDAERESTVAAPLPP